MSQPDTRGQSRSTRCAGEAGAPVMQLDSSSFVRVDPREQARRIERAHPGWTVWFGTRTARFWAIHRAVPDMVDAATAAEITKLIESWTALAG
jgi:hypothetical protein